MGIVMMISDVTIATQLLYHISSAFGRHSFHPSPQAGIFRDVSLSGLLVQQVSSANGGILGLDINR